MSFYLLVLFAYLVGSIPFGLLLGRLFADIDIRDHGSGNIGATNVNRVLGRKLGAATLLCDVLKALAPTLIAVFLLQNQREAAFVGLAAVLGHCFPIFLKFKGGKGVATAFGVILAVSFKVGLAGIVTWLLAARLSKYSSVGALVACLIIPIVSYVLDRDPVVAGALAAISAIIVIRHKENIQRLWSGSENSP